jgi:hypothetical protein
VKSKYIFIVGLPRTGTKLMMNILENSQDRPCHITRENFFLGRIINRGVRQKMRKIGDMSIDANVHKFVDAMYAGKFFGDYWDKLADGRLGVAKETMLQEILNSDRSDKAIYSILLRIHTPTTDDIILGDKSGPHLYHVPTLLEWFPDAKVVHTFRDPRAVLASEHKKLLHKRHQKIARLKKADHKAQALFLKLTEPFASLGIVLYITIAWLYAVRLHSKYKKLYPHNYYLSKFEDLVNEPEKSVRKVCEFMGIEFHSTMLNPPKIGSSYTREEGTGFDQGTLDRWQEYLKPWMSAGLFVWGKKYLKEFGYIH